MTDFATIKRDYVSIRKNWEHYKTLLKDCVDSALIIPSDKLEYLAIKAKWELLRKEFPGTNNPSVTFYPILLHNYMKDKITREEFEEKAKLWLENLQLHEILYKREVDIKKKALENAYNDFRKAHQNIPEFEEVFDCIEKHPDEFWTLLSAEFEI